jgi:hypothetical protein
MPGVMTSPNLVAMSYLLVLAAAGGVFVSVDVVEPLPPWLQPAKTPTVRPNSAIRVNNLFIVRLTLTINPSRTSKKFPYQITVPRENQVFACP